MQTPSTSDPAPCAPVTADDEPSATSSWFVGVATVVAMASLPFLNLLAGNPSTPVDGQVLRTWWLVTLIPGLVVVVAALAVNRAVGRYVGGMLGVGLYLLWSLPTTTVVRDALGVSLADGRWWLLCTVAALLVAAPLMRFVPAQGFVAIVAIALSGTAAVTIATNAPPTFDQTATEAAPPDATFARTNDVWFIVLDGLAGEDALADLGYDGAAFASALEADGFRIQRNATSNYPLTNLSISSTMSMTYTWDSPEEPTEGPFFLHMSGGNATVELLRANGYSYAHAFPGYYIGSRCAGFEDVCFGDTGSITETETALATLTPLRGFILDRPEQEDIAITNDPSNQVRRILDAQLPTPAYHFIHMLNPHPPYLRDADCNVRAVPLQLADWGSADEYVGAVRCLHRQLEGAAKLILAADPDAIIVIQGDHGHRLGTDAASSGSALLDQDVNFSIFSAFHLPDDCADIAIPDDLTPVNTMRIVRACLEDREPDLLVNRRFPIQRDRQ